MQVSTDTAINRFASAYQKLFKRMPQDLHAIDSNWVIVNGARFQVVELEFLSAHMELQYRLVQEQKRGLINRLVRWLRQ
ncbi:MAG: hypothetical protein ABI835_03915 [Chloroflexota bacterium]